MVAQVNYLWRKDVKGNVENVIWFGVVDNGVLSLCSTSINLKRPISRHKQQSTWCREECELHSSGLKVSGINGNTSWFLRKNPFSSWKRRTLDMSAYFFRVSSIYCTRGELSHPALHMTFDFSVNSWIKLFEPATEVSAAKTDGGKLKDLKSEP